MFKNIHWRYYLKYGIIAAISYSVPLFFFIRNASYEEGWVLYIGNFAFMVSIAAFIFIFSNNRKENSRSGAMFLAGHITTVFGVIIAAVISLILLKVLVPGFPGSHVSPKVFRDAPANIVEDNTNGMMPMIFLNLIVCNCCTGAFVSLLLPFSLKDNQTKKVDSSGSHLSV